MLHGGGGRAEQVFKTSGVSKHANDFRYVFVFPQGVDNHWADGRGTTDPEKAGVDDVGFIGELIDSFVGVGAVDGARVFSAGISNGGFMTFRLACELSDKVKGIAPIATGFQSRLDGSCQSTSISSVYFIHGDRDRFVPREGGEVRSSAGGSVFSTADTVKKWSKLLGCATLSQAQTKDSISLPADRTSLETSLGEGCAEGKKFKYVNVRNGGHTWPGGGFQPELVVGATTLELNASRSILEYFSH